jgi:drug/metabolite transporter (DMT)-like permease
MKSEMRGMWAAGFAAFCWGTATVMSKSALNEVSPIALLTLQLLASAIALWGFIFLMGRKVPPFKDIRYIAALGLLEPGLAYLLGLIGLVSIGAGVATLIQATEAIMIVAVSALLFKEKPTVPFIGLSGLALAGLAVVIGLPGNAISSAENLGVVLMFLATASAAFYVVLSGRVIGDHDPLVVVGFQQLAALLMALCCLPLEALSATGLVLPHHGSVWFVVVLSGLIQYAIAFSAYMYALAKISANRAGSFLNLTPVFGVVIAFVALGERLNLLQVLGAAVTIFAVFLIHRNAHEPADDKTKGKSCAV